MSPEQSAKFQITNCLDELFRRELPHQTSSLVAAARYLSLIHI